MIRLALSISLAAALGACGTDNDPLFTSDAAPNTASQVLPDTLALPFLPLDAFLRPPPDSGRFNTLGEISGWIACPPCPPGALCEPCAPFGVLLSAPAPGGLVRVGVTLPPNTRQDTTLLTWGRVYTVSVEVDAYTSPVYADPAFGRDSMQHVRLQGLGFTRTERSGLFPLKHP